MKKLLFFILGFCLLGAHLNAASGKTPVFILGKKSGSVDSVMLGARLHVDAHAMAKKLGGSGRFLPQSKQLEIKIKGFTAVFTVGSKSAAVNGAQEDMTAEAVQSGGTVLVPVSFFYNAQLSAATERQFYYEEGACYVEKLFNVEYDGAVVMGNAASVRLKTKSPVTFTQEESNKKTVSLKIKNAVLKRDVSESLEKNSFIYRVSVKQCKEDICLKAALGKKGEEWAFEKMGDRYVLTAGAKGSLGSTGLSFPPSADSSVNEAPQKKTVAAPKPSAAKADYGDAIEIDPAVFYSGGTAVAAAPRGGGQSVSAGKEKNKKMRIVIDPGHGGKDPGAVRKGSSPEKYINLRVGLEVADILKKRGFDVKMTRDDDKFLALHERSKISNDFNADLFVSIHTNASPRSSANGFEVYFRSEKATDAEAAEVAALENEALQYEDTGFNFVDVLLRSLAANEHMNESSKLAAYVRNSVFKTKGLGIFVNRTGAIKQANFYVLRGVDSPAVLVEMAYISSPSDRRQLNNRAIRLKLAQGIAQGVIDYAKAEGYM